VARQLHIDSMKSGAAKTRQFGAFLFTLFLLWGGLSSRDASAQLPDLAVHFKGPATAFAGQDIGGKIQLTVKNIGGTEATGFYVDIILTEPTGTEHICVRERIESVLPKKSVRLLFDKKHPVLIPGKIQPGKNQLCAFADSTDAIRESREKNNKVCQVTTITSKDF
jgi:hypothetical protein